VVVVVEDDDVGKALSLYYVILLNKNGDINEINLLINLMHKLNSFCKK
jgi:hypothetical protein